MNYKDFFKGKKITIMGLGLLGRGIGYTKFLAECGADLTVTDLKDAVKLAAALRELKKYNLSAGKAGNIKYVLGEHRLEDFQNCDMVIKAAGVPLDSVYIAEAKKNGIPVEMDVSLFAKCAPFVTIVGITGTRGKSMTTAIIYDLLKKGLPKRNIYLGGNVRGHATLPLLKKVNPPAGGGDILVAELDSWQLQGFGDSKISPNVSVFTTFMPDHMNYYKGSMEQYFDDKANIFKYQKESDTLVIGETMQKIIRKKDVKGKLVVAKHNSVTDWNFSVPGEHNLVNLAMAVEVAKVFGVNETKIKKIVKDFKGVEGRLQLLRTYKGIKIYNDNNATTPEATIAGIKALSGVGPLKFSGSNPGDLILICGGNDKNTSIYELVKIAKKNCKSVVTIPGTGTTKFVELFGKGVVETPELKSAVKAALASVSRGDTILFSPAFSSFAQFNNEYERNDLFVKIIKDLK